MSESLDFLGFRIQWRRKRGTSKWYGYAFISDRPVRSLKDKTRALPGDRHGGFGAAWETDREQSRHRAPGRLNQDRRPRVAAGAFHGRDGVPGARS